MPISGQQQTGSVETSSSFPEGFASYFNNISSDQPQVQHPVFDTLEANPKKIYKRKTSEIDFNKTTVAEMYNVRQPRSVSIDFGEKFLFHNRHLLPEDPYKFRDSKILVGLEVEVENVLSVDPSIRLCFWDQTEDGSLRNNGWEFKSLACPVLYVEPALRQLFFGLNNNIEFSKRCSIHVHMDIRQLSLSQALGMFLTYTAVENLLFRFASLERRRNIFCVPVTETRLLTSKWSKPLDVFVDIHNVWQKYSAVNLLPMTNFGTMEFRQMPGTKNIKQLLIWIDLLSRLRIFAYRYPLETIISNISDLNTSSNYLRFVESVFEDLTVYLDTSALLQEMEKPVTLVKNSAVTNKFHQFVCSNKDENSAFGKLFKTSSINSLSPDQLLSLEVLAAYLGSSVTLAQAWEWLHNDSENKTYALMKWPKYAKHILGLGPNPNKQENS